jgi:hypothetical protein
VMTERTQEFLGYNLLINGMTVTQVKEAKRRQNSRRS